MREKVKVAADEMVEFVKKVLHEGNVNRIIIANTEGNTVIEIPVTVGVVGVIIAPVLAALAGIAALASHYTVEIERKE